MVEAAKDGVIWEVLLFCYFDLQVELLGIYMMEGVIVAFFLIHSDIDLRSLRCGCWVLCLLDAPQPDACRPVVPLQS